MSSDVRSAPVAGQSLATSLSRTTGARGDAPGHGAPTSTGRLMSIVIIVLTVGVATVWSLVALHQLSASVARESASHLDHARRAFELTRARRLDSLRALRSEEHTSE